MNNKLEETISVIPSCLFSLKINFSHGIIISKGSIYVYDTFACCIKFLEMTFVMIYAHDLFFYITFIHSVNKKYACCYPPF